MKLLIIEDNQDHYELIEDMLSVIDDFKVSLVHETRLKQGANRLISEQFDLCLCDLKLADSSIEETVAWLSSQSTILPIIALTSLNSLEVARGLLKQGVQDYIAKDDLSVPLLYKTCRYAVERWHYQQRIEAYNQDMQIFCASLSHDFNGHISKIMCVSDILRSDISKRIPLTVNDNALFDYIENSTNRIIDLTAGLQQYLSVGYSQKEFQEVNLTELLTNVVVSIRSSTTAIFEAKIQKVFPVIQGSAPLLHILFHNLISNAIKFNEKTPKITVSCTIEEQSVTICVQDNGIGFDVKEANYIFSPFYRLKNSKKITGSGLGLSIVKRVVEHHHAAIRVESELGVGSKFILTFKQ